MSGKNVYTEMPTPGSEISAVRNRMKKKIYLQQPQPSNLDLPAACGVNSALVERRQGFKSGRLYYGSQLEQIEYRCVGGLERLQGFAAAGPFPGEIGGKGSNRLQ